MARQQLMATPSGSWHDFASPEALAETLAERIAARLHEAVSVRGQATLAVSGGKTPLRLFRALSQTRIDWARVIVTLVDERFVPQDDERSNARLVAGNLLVGPAAAASFVPLYRPGVDVGEAARFAELSIGGLPQPFDVVVLGMGTDGHSASFFPDAPDIAALLENSGGRSVLPVMAPSAGEPRLTLSVQLLRAARLLVLHIEGEEKKNVLIQAIDRQDRPVSAFFDHVDSVQIFWSP